MTDYSTVSFTTDYGLVDGFVAACHGVMLQGAPQLRIIDVTHQINPGDVRQGALILAQTLPYLPQSIHVAVVDPGVGTTRRPIAIETPSGILIGPDNGLLMWAADVLGEAIRAFTLTNTSYHRHPVSHTFHGRDIFTPVAAAIASGINIDDVGQPVSVRELIRLPEPFVESTDDAVVSEVLAIDRFGNIQLAARTDTLDFLSEKLHIDEHVACRGDMFAAAATGELIVLGDSAGYVSIAVNGGSAANRLSLQPGDHVRISSV